MTGGDGESSMDPASNKMRTARIEDNNRKMAARNEHNGQEGS